MLTRSGFQPFVNAQPAPGEAGDFAGAGIRMAVQAPTGGYVADANGVIVGNFAWGTPATGLASNTHSAGSILGFVHRENQTIIVDFLASRRTAIQAGFPVYMFGRGDFLAFFSAGAAAGAQVYADPTTGAPTTVSGGNILTPFKVVTTVPVDAAFTGVINDQSQLTVSALSAGVVAPGQFLTGTGVGPNIAITSQVLPLTGGETVGGNGRYLVNSLAAVASTAMTAMAGKVAKISSWQV